MRLLLLLTLLAACAHTPAADAAARCPESRDLGCVTKVECSYDRDRGCNVCRCSNPWAATHDGRLPTDLPPDSNVQPPR
jgi:hypothetical protein